MKIAFYTLGCKVNQYETQALEQLVTQRGHSLVPFEETAELEKILSELPPEMAAAKESLVTNASITGFQAGLRLGLILGWECDLPPRRLP